MMISGRQLLAMPSPFLWDNHPLRGLWRQGVQYMNMPNTKKVTFLSLVLEFMWSRRIGMLVLMARHVRIEAGAKDAVATCLDADSPFGVQVRKLV
jgi:hypothetical protein